MRVDADSVVQRTSVHLLIVGLGGATGSALRWLVTDSMGPENGSASIFIVNIAGSLLLGLLAAYPARRNSNLSLLLGVGFAGGLTTFSTFAVDVAQQLDAGEVTAAAMNSLGTASLALLAAGVGYRLGRASL